MCNFEVVVQHQHTAGVGTVTDLYIVKTGRQVGKTAGGLVCGPAIDGKVVLPISARYIVDGNGTGRSTVTIDVGAAVISTQRTGLGENIIIKAQPDIRIGCIFHNKDIGPAGDEVGKSVRWCSGGTYRVVVYLVIHVVTYIPVRIGIAAYVNFHGSIVSPVAGNVGRRKCDGLRFHNRSGNQHYQSRYQPEFIVSNSHGIWFYLVQFSVSFTTMVLPVCTPVPSVILSMYLPALTCRKVYCLSPVGSDCISTSPFSKSLVIR